LDSKTTAEILALFDELNGEGRTIIMVTHEDEVAERAKRVVRLRDGLLQSDKINSPEDRQAAAARALALIPASDKVAQEVEA
jgi:putative ABC transport system ATP-binding protein